MRIFNNIGLIDLAIYTNKTLIFTDFHIGYEEALNKQGLMVPRFQFPEIIKRLDNIFKKLKSSKNSKNFLGHKKSQSDFFVNKKIKKIIINGDVKHEFGTISEQEWRHTLKLLDYLGQYCREIILIKGNHDTILGPIAKKRNIKVLEHYIINSIKNSYNNKNSNNSNNLNKNSNKKNIINNNPYNIDSIFNNYKNKNSINNKNNNKKIKKINIKNKIEKLLNNKNKKINANKILIVHGDKLPDQKLIKDVDTIIIGHEHPAVSISQGPRAELFKAYLIGKWQRKNLIVQPSFNLVTEGTDVLKEEVLSPFLQQNLRNFNAIIVGDKLYEFGKLRDLD